MENRYFIDSEGNKCQWVSPPFEGWSEYPILEGCTPITREEFFEEEKTAIDNTLCDKEDACWNDPEFLRQMEEKWEASNMDPYYYYEYRW